MIPPCLAAWRLFLELRGLPHSVQNALREWRDDCNRSLSYQALRDDPAWCARVEHKAIELLCALDPPERFTGSKPVVDPETGEELVAHYEDGSLLGVSSASGRDDGGPV